MILAHAAEIAALKAQNDRLAQRVVTLEEELRLERAHRYAPRSEKIRDRIFNEAEQAAAEEEVPDDDAEPWVVPDTGLPEGERPEPHKRGRKPLSADLPRQRVEYDLPEGQKSCPCCNKPMHRMGENVTEQLHIETKATVLRNVRFKYACRHCERTGINTPVVTAPMPAQPLPGSVATAATLALVLASKYVDGTPLYRLTEALARANVSVSRGTMGHWVIRTSEKHFERIYDVLKEKLRGQDVIHGDETRVQVLKEKDRKAQAQSYMWGYRSAEGAKEPIVLFDYQPGRGQKYPQAFLAGYTGQLMSDGYDAWRTLKGAAHLGCMAHARRKFNDALKARKKASGPSVEALKFFEALYEVERLAGQSPPDGETRSDYTLRLRQEHSVPVLSAFKGWLDKQASQVLPESLTGKAIAYTRNQWEYLIRYASDGRAPIDNNLLERDIRIFVTGRKNWLFSDTVAGARASAVIYSLVLTCRACGIDPHAWLTHLLTELPQRGPETDIEDLLPFNFVARNDARAANTS
ncbi:transposase [Sphingobium wenxiniae]|uniref:Transposase n=1 Tax=Sphingobium wenxiniae (strain DSM 21828 / CGMCC 1.7748 / JZ-1) TaxID=595605 RepID=A0A562KKY8_SPHWJ|nr:transposase [Sphingobium wenxiniae]